MAALRTRVLKALGTTDYRRFIVLARSRVGSFLLTSYLDSHPNVRAQGEIVRKLDGRHFADVVGSAFGKEPRSVRAKGFKILYYHPLDEKSGGIWEMLAGMDELHVIHLKRRNILRTLISRQIAEQQGVWRLPGGDPASNGSHDEAINGSDDGSNNVASGADKRVTFTVEELTAGFEKTRKWETVGEARFAGHPMLEVHYEDLVSDTEATFRRVTDFLGVPFVQPRTNLVRQNPEDVRDLVANYDELVAAFRDTEWEPFFRS